MTLPNLLTSFTVCFYNTTSFRHIKLIALTLTRSRTSENSGLLRVLRGRAGQRARISVVRGGKCLIKRYGSKVSQSSSTLEHWLTMLPCNISHGLSQLLERKGRTAGSHLIYYELIKGFPTLTNNGRLAGHVVAL